MIIRQQYHGPQLMLDLLYFNIMADQYRDSPHYWKIRLFLGKRFRNVEKQIEILKKNNVKRDAYFMPDINGTQYLAVDLIGEPTSFLKNEAKEARKSIKTFDKVANNLLASYPQKAIDMLYKCIGKEVPKKKRLRSPVRANVIIID